MYKHISTSSKLFIFIYISAKTHTSPRAHIRICVNIYVYVFVSVVMYRKLVFCVAHPVAHGMHGDAIASTAPGASAMTSWSGTHVCITRSRKIVRRVQAIRSSSVRIYRCGVLGPLKEEISQRKPYAKPSRDITYQARGTT